MKTEIKNLIEKIAEGNYLIDNQDLAEILSRLVELLEE